MCYFIILFPFHKPIVYCTFHLIMVNKMYHLIKRGSTIQRLRLNFRARCGKYVVKMFQKSKSNNFGRIGVSNKGLSRCFAS